MTYLKNASVILIIVASIVTLSEASSKPKAPSKPQSQPKPKYVIPSQPGPIKFVPAGPGEKFHPRPPRGKR